MNKSLVSIIIPTYNRAHLIGETLDSVMAQSYINWECIVVDDGSTDNTAKILLDYSLKDTRFKYYQRPEARPKGANACRNYGFELSEGEYINWLDSDDIISNNKIEEQLNRLIENDGDIATCKWGRFTSNTNFSVKNELGIYKNYNLGVKLIKDYGDFNTFFPPHVFLVKSSLIRKSGYWNENLLINQDGEFFCRLLIKSGKISFSEKSFVLYRENDTYKTSEVDNINKAIHLILSWKLIE
jgi:glycosyltransferase involved in cell wall biosynthesis